MDKLIVSEHFYSIQGEGKYIGTPAVFLRLGGCNLKCGFRDKSIKSSWVCDTKEVWTKSEAISIDDLLELFKKNGYLSHLYRNSHLVITGGEPLLQQDILFNFLDKLNKAIEDLFKVKFYDLFVEIETNGTILPNEKIDNLISFYNISPKLSNSNETKNKRDLKLTENFHTNSNRIRLTNCIYKFVVNNDNDIQEIVDLSIEKQLSHNKIYLMPSGETKEDIEKKLSWLSEICKNKYYKLSTRLHLHIWNKKTGV